MGREHAVIELAENLENTKALIHHLALAIGPRIPKAPIAYGRAALNSRAVLPIQPIESSDGGLGRFATSV